MSAGPARSEADPSAPPVAALPACPICGSERWRHPRPHTRLRSCSRCGTVLNDRSRTREEEESRYACGSGGPLAGEEGIAAARWQWLVERMAPAPDGLSLSLLDVGCGHGAFLKMARESGARVMGVELDPAAVSTCRASGIPVVHGSLFDAGPPPGSWDVITLWDVLDHLDDPAGALRLLVTTLAPGGTLVVRGRNARIHAPLKGALARARRLSIPDVAVVHRWAFSPAGYLRLLSQAGLSAVRLHPGAPTPGDRYAAFGWRPLSQGIKAGVFAAALALYYASRRGLYPFPSVLITGRRAPTSLP